MTPAEVSLIIAGIQMGGQLAQFIMQNASQLDLTDEQLQLLIDHSHSDVAALGDAILAAKNKPQG